MTFSDDDLKRLKLDIEIRNRRIFDGWTFKHVLALIARLEASERLINHGICDCSEANELKETWRRAAGKS